MSTEEKVNQIKNLSNLSEWRVEVSSFLKEIQCPYGQFYEGPLEPRLSKMEDRFLLLDYLLAELLAARMMPQPVEEKCSSPTAENLDCIVKVGFERITCFYPF